MNEIELSNDLKIIEFEINHHKNIVGQSIWEIGRRLIHVKDNDLAHGEFGAWLESIGLGHSEANRFMKIANEIPNSATWQNLGSRALYLIATLPEEERTRVHATEKGELKTPDEMTVRELQDLKKQLKQKDELIESLGDSMHDFEMYAKELENENERLKAKEPEVIEKVVEVIPDDYQQLKENNRTLAEHIELYKQSADYNEKKYKELLEERAEVDEKSKRYDELTEAIHKAEGNLNKKQREIVAYKNLLDTTIELNKFLDSASYLIYMDDMDILKQDALAIQELEKLLKRVDTWSSDLWRKLDKQIILEGEYSNE